jgi:hypothetical protein
MVLRQNYSSRQPDDNYARTRGEDNSSDVIHCTMPAHEVSVDRLPSKRQDLPAGIRWRSCRICRPGVYPLELVAPLHLVPE